MRVREHLRRLREHLGRRISRLRSEASEAGRLAAGGRYDLRRELEAAVTKALKPGERVEIDTWTQVSRRRRPAPDPAAIDASSPVGALRSAGSAAGMLRGAIGWVDDALPARIVVTDRRLLVAQRTVTTPVAVRAAPRAGARVLWRRLGMMALDPGDGQGPLRLSGHIEGDDLRALATALRRG